jgi:hypothetical protein
MAAKRRSSGRERFFDAAVAVVKSRESQSSVVPSRVDDEGGSGSG